MRALALLATLLLTTVPLHADTLGDGRSWPPDPSLYAAPGTEVAPGLKVGDMLDEKNADLAKDLLPPEILEHYKKGHYRNPIDSWPTGIIHRDKSFEEASEKNAGKYALDPDTGAIVEKATGKQPEYVYGFAFPKIEENDPQGGLKALWNQYHNWWNGGSYHFLSDIIWTSPDGVDRKSTQEVWWQYYDNQNPKYRVPNPQGFAWQSVTTATSPADLQGTASLTWRSRDPKRRDQQWAYVPALRRVRAVSPANRSDGILGSDLSSDDGNFVDMKPEDFIWKTVGVREGLRIIEPDSVHGRGGPLEWIAGSGFRDVWTKPTPAAGFQKPGWKGHAWAPASAALAKRKMWVLEGEPRDRYYLYGKMQVWVDAESWIGVWNRKYSWKGELLNDYQVSGYLHHPVSRDGDPEVEWLWSAQHAWQCAENFKNGRATLAGIRPENDYAGMFDRRVTHNIAQLFDYQTLNRFGK
jgi:hypothetical protein